MSFLGVLCVGLSFEIRQVEFGVLFGAVAGTALLLHLTRRVPLLAVVVTVGGSFIILNALWNLPTTTYEFFGAALAFDPIVKFLLLVALAINLLLALAALLNPDTREYVPFLYWCWLPWCIAVSIDNFGLAILAWAFGLYTLALTLAPGRAGQVGGAAHYLLVIVLSAPGLFIANRFFELYPLTPEQTSLIQTGILFLAWSLGLALAVVPFHIWLGALAEETAPVFLAALASWGLPLGLWFLFGLMRRYLWLTEKSNLLALLVIAGLVTTLVGGFSAAAERRARRWVVYASLFTLGMILIDLGRARLDLLLNAGLAIAGRGLALALSVAGLAVFRATNQSWARALALGAIAFGGAAVVGVPLTPLFVANLPLWSEYAVSDTRVFVLLALASLGVWIGVARVVYPMIMEWRVEMATEGAKRAGEGEDDGVGREGGGAEWRGGAEAEERGGGETVSAGVMDKRMEGEVEDRVIEGVQGGRQKAEGGQGRGGGDDTGSPDEEYDPIEALRQLAGRVWNVLRRTSPGVARGLLQLAAQWQAIVGIAVILVLVAALLLVGIFPTLLLDPLASAVGRPDYIR